MSIKNKSSLVLAVLAVLIVLIVLNNLFVFRAPMTPQPTSPPKASNKLFSIVRLVGDDGLTFCSGTVINDHTIVTASHCVMAPGSFGAILNTSPIEIRANDNVARGVFGTAYYFTGQMDQALITGDFKRFQPRSYSTSPEFLTSIRLRVNAQFVSCGYPLHGDLYCTYTYFVRPISFMWAVHGVLLPGMSGGPTMLADGTLVAVNVAVEDEYSIVSPIYNLYPESK